MRRLTSGHRWVPALAFAAGCSAPGPSTPAVTDASRASDSDSTQIAAEAGPELDAFLDSRSNDGPATYLDASASQPGTDAAARPTEGGNASAPPQDAGTPNIDASTIVETLTQAQKELLCDWMARELGGYGASTNCGGGETVLNYPNQSTCVQQVLTDQCAITVAQVEACVQAEAPSLGCVEMYDTCHPLLTCSSVRGSD